MGLGGTVTIKTCSIPAYLAFHKSDWIENSTEEERENERER